MFHCCCALLSEVWKHQNNPMSNGIFVLILTAEPAGGATSLRDLQVSLFWCCFKTMDPQQL